MAQPWANFWGTLTRFDRAKMAPEVAIRNTIGFAAAIVLATIFRSPSAGVVAGIGALNVSYSDSRDPYIVRARRMLLSSVLCATAVILGALFGNNNALAIALATLWAFAAGMLVALGTAAGDLGVITLVTVIVFAARPLGPALAFQSGLLALAGGLLQLLLAIVLWPIRRYEPERRIVESLYTALAAVANSPQSSTDAPPVSAQLSDAQDTLRSLYGDHGEEAERQIFLLNQAERIRLSLLHLGGLWRRLQRDHQGKPCAAALLNVLNGASEALASVRAGTLEPFEHAAADFDSHQWGSHSTFFAALVMDARQEIDALGGQLRAVFRAHAAQPWQHDENISWRLRFSSARAKLQANLSFESTAFRHAARLAACIAVGDTLGRVLKVQRTYWIPMTIAIVLKPDFTGTLSRGVLRISGTFAGLILATVLFHFVHTGIATDIALMAIFTFMLRWAGAANYGIFVTALSAMVVLLIATTGVAPHDVIRARAINTALGGAMAMIAYAIWPTWERTQAAAALAEMIEQYREYFRRVVAAYSGAPVDEIDDVRVKGRRARSNAEASVDRIAAEPGVSAHRMTMLHAILVNSHVFVNAVMALESGLYHTDRQAVRPATIRFAQAADVTLAAVTTSLRLGLPLPKDLPDLREAHNRIVESHVSPSERYSLVNLEMDRIVTSLNTLSEQVALWISLLPTKK
ncbi:MAG: FUSC family protein [Acidobacteriota bacterium]|nr:FUSC family protein [Acidobacteriota bacterium]